MLPVRRVALVILPALLTLGLTSCGDEATPGGKTSDRLDAVTISGDVGAAPEVKWKTRMDAGKIETETVTKGDGDELHGQDEVLAHIWIGNGYTEKQAFSTYEDQRAEVLTVNNQLPEFLAAIKGATLGSRIAVTSSAEEAFGEAGNPELGIGNKDTVLVVIDLVSGVLDKVDGERTPYPDWMPTPIFKGGVPTGFDFDGAPAPIDELRRVQLVKGTGPEVEKGQTIAVRYLGQVFGGKKPFDENFSGETPTAFGIGVEQVIKAWDQALVGSTVGSRIVIEVPPSLGYGADGNKDAGITATDTLVFVIDILAAA